MENKYIIEVTDTTYEGTTYVTYVNNNSWESKTPQFFTDEAEANSVTKEFEDYIKTEYGSYAFANIHFHVIDLSKIIEEYTESISELTEALSDKINEVTLVRSRLDKAINSGDFEEAHDALNDYESVVDRSNQISDNLNKIKDKLNKYKSWI